MITRTLALFAALLLATGCPDDEASGGPATDTGAADVTDAGPGADTADAGTADTGTADAGVDGTAGDTGGPTDSAQPDAADTGMDTGPEDTGMDAGPEDTGMDAGPEDTGTDTGPEDTGADAGPEDTGPGDTGPGDTGPGDTGAEDTGPGDTGPEDAGPGDTGAEDTGMDTGAEDTGTDTGPDATLACASACDCEQGWACADGTCVLGIQPVFCCTNDGCPEASPCVTADGAAGLCGIETSPHFGALIVNEVLIDGALDGDPNGDGEPGDPVGDEFVELVNASGAALDLAGMTLFETDLPALARHTFTAGTTLAPGEAIVVFGGGTAPDDAPGAHFEVANALDPGIPFGLNLDNDGDTLRLLDADGKLVALFAWGPEAPLPALSDESYTRSPDVTGPFVPHTTAAPATLFSPGTHADGTPF